MKELYLYLHASQSAFYSRKLILEHCKLLPVIRRIPPDVKTFHVEGCKFLEDLDRTLHPAFTRDSPFSTELIQILWKWVWTVDSISDIGIIPLFLCLIFKTWVLHHSVCSSLLVFHLYSLIFSKLDGTVLYLPEKRIGKYFPALHGLLRCKIMEKYTRNVKTLFDQQQLMTFKNQTEISQCNVEMDAFYFTSSVLGLMLFLDPMVNWPPLLWMKISQKHWKQ